MRAVVAALAVAAIAVPAASAAGPRVTAVDTSGYPTVRATLVTASPQTRPPQVRENGAPVVGLEATNLGRAKSIVVAIDRSRSMRGPALAAATAAARRFVAAKGRHDRIAVVAFGSRATLLTGFSSSTIDADAALAALEVDAVQGTALYDGVVTAANAVDAEPLAGRVVVVLTDGKDVSSQTTLAAAADAARQAGATVHAVGIESPDFSPAPLRKLVAQTGGRYRGAADTTALSRVYDAISAELRRTWQLAWMTPARPGERLELTISGARATAVVPGVSAVVVAPAARLPDAVFSLGPILVALAVGGLALAAFALLFRAPQGARLRRRIAPHLGQRREERARGQVQERFVTASFVMQATERAFGHLRVWHALHRKLERADLPLRTVELVYIAAGCSFAFGTVFAVAGAPSLMILIAMAAAGAAPIGYVSLRARRRIAALDAQLPDVLITLAASLKAGHSFRQSLQAVVDEGQPPTSQEFKRVLTETRLGRPMDEALAEMSERVGSKNLGFVITAVTIQRQVGGSLAGIFDMVAEAVRQRHQFARKIRSLTAMGRMSAYVLVGIPFFLMGAITLLNPEYIEPLWTTSAGHTLLMLGGGMMVVGSFLLRKMVSFKG